ncbi:MAG: LamG domain-containing protein [Rhodoferax sp.]|nr:LamG domain-containing protein [Rhodoferax sp.]
MAAFVLMLLHGAGTAATYTSASTPFSWIDPATHTKVGHLTAPYKFNGGGATGCGTVPPTLDDTISDLIPLGFTFVYGATSYTDLRIQSNGRLQFGNTTCGSGTVSVGPPQTYPFVYPNASMNATMKVFGVDLDHTNLVDSPNYPAAASRTSCTSMATCYVAFRSIGTSPNRQFVVTWKNVPEWVSFSNTSGSFDVQIILNESGTFVYQYGTISHGGSGTAEVGWQLSTADWEVLKFGASLEPAPNTAILFYVPSQPPLAEYRFEQGAWAAGGVGQVADSSVGARGGVALGAAQTTGAGRICRGASIPANTLAATVDGIRTGVRFSDSGVNMLGQGTVMFWYQANTPWSGVGAKAVQLLDATQTSGQWFSLTKTATGTLFFEVTDSAGAGVVRSVESPAQSFAAGTWVHVAVSWNFNGLSAPNSDRISVFVNAAAPTISSFTTTGSLSAGLDFLTVGDNPSGITGTKGSVNSGDGTMDELRIYNLDLNQGQIAGASIESRPCTTFFIDHFELRHGAWSGIACAPATMTVVACSNASCSSLYTGGVVTTLSHSGAATLWDPSAGGATVVIGSGQSSVTRSFYTATGTATFNVTGAGIPVLPSGPRLCNGVAGSCNWTSANGGLVMTVPSAGVVTGGKPVAVTVQAVQSSGPTPGAACVPVQNLAGAGLKAWAAPVNPASFAATSVSAGVTVGGVPQVAAASAGPYTTAAAALPASNNLTGLAFDANATTTVWLRHMDTGQFNLSATLDTTSTATTPALSLAGSATVTSLPVGYAVAVASVRANAAIEAACAAGASAACDTAAGGGVRVGAAGSPFALSVSAALWTVDGDTDLSDNPIAPGYVGAVTLSPLLAAPQGGSVGTLGSLAANLASGSANIPAQTWSQSGALRVAVSGTYLTQPVTGRSAVLGRFSPRNFTTSVTTQGCGAFTYAGQPVSVVTVRAMDGSAVPAASANYRGAFARAVTLSDAGGSVAGSFSANLVAAGSFAGGVATAAPVYSFTTPRTAPLTLQLRATDSEASSAGFSEGSAPLRSGRLHMQNAYGSELLALPVPLTAQFWTGINYATNTADSCTLLPTSSISMGNYQKQLNACETQLSPVGSISIVAGKASGSGLLLSRPGATNAGSVDLSFNAGATASGITCVGAAAIPATAANLPWFGPNQGARATFGVFKSPIIYSRENY